MDPTDTARGLRVGLRMAQTLGQYVSLGQLPPPPQLRSYSILLSLFRIISLLRSHSHSHSRFSHALCSFSCRLLPLLPAASFTVVSHRTCFCHETNNSSKLTANESRLVQKTTENQIKLERWQL